MMLYFFKQKFAILILASHMSDNNECFARLEENGARVL